MNRRAKTIISTYASDTSGGPSALYELGGLSVIHDASGCNSTYTTHDEPRWYHKPSAVAITGLTEIDAVMGNDGKIISDILAAASSLHPRFVSITSTPVPYVMGTDLKAIAAIVEEKLHIPAWYCPSNGMQSYVSTVASSLIAYISRFVPVEQRSRDFSVNLVGATPLDFATQERIDHIKAVLLSEGIRIQSVLAMGSGVEEIAQSGSAWLDIAISESGNIVASSLEKSHHIPFISGLPFGQLGADRFIRAVKGMAALPPVAHEGMQTVAIIGDSVQNRAIAENLAHFSICSITPLGSSFPSDEILTGEEETQKRIAHAHYLIADPLYKPIVPDTCTFIPYPHFAFSGRIYGGGVDLTCEGLDTFLEVLK